MDQAGVVRAEQQRGLTASRRAGDVYLVGEDAGLAGKPAQRLGEVLQGYVLQLQRQAGLAEVGDVQGGVSRRGQGTA